MTLTGDTGIPAERDDSKYGPQAMRAIIFEAAVCLKYHLLNECG